MKRHPFISEQLVHPVLGMVIYTKECAVLQEENKDEGTIIVWHADEFKKTSLSLLSVSAAQQVPQEHIDAVEFPGLKDEMRDQGLL